MSVHIVKKRKGDNEEVAQDGLNGCDEKEKRWWRKRSKRKVSKQVRNYRNERHRASRTMIATRKRKSSDQLVSDCMCFLNIRMYSRSRLGGGEVTF